MSIQREPESKDREVVLAINELRANIVSLAGQAKVVGERFHLVCKPIEDKAGGEGTPIPEGISQVTAQLYDLSLRVSEIKGMLLRLEGRAEV